MSALSTPRRAMVTIGAGIVSFGAAAGCALAAGALLHVGPASATATARTTSAEVAPAEVVAAYPSLRSPNPTQARSIDKPNGLAFFLDHEAGLDPEAAAVVSDTAARALVLLPKARGQLCLMRIPASGASTDNCVDDGTAVRSGIVNGTPGHVFGLVPADVRSIAFTLSDGTRATAPVGDDGAFEAPAEAVTGTFTTAGALASLGDLIPASRAPSGMISGK